MSEGRRRCHLWPHCAIHLGIPRLLDDVPEDERAEIRRQRAAGMSVADLVRAYDLTDRQVRSVEKARRPASREKPGEGWATPRRS